MSLHTLSDYSARADKMLKKWGTEILEGCHEPPHPLEMLTGVSSQSTGLAPSGTGPLSPMAEHADRILRELYDLDRGVVEYLTAYAMGQSLNDMVRNFKAPRSTVNMHLKESQAAWTMAVYFRLSIYNPNFQKVS